MYEINDEMSAVLDSNVGITIVELIRALMGAPPEFAHLVAITDYLVLVHQASETYVTHSRHNIYFMLPQLREKRTSLKASSNGSSSDDSINMVENSKLNKALTNEQVSCAREAFPIASVALGKYISSDFLRSRGLGVPRRRTARARDPRITLAAVMIPESQPVTDRILKAYVYLNKVQIFP